MELAKVDQEAIWLGKLFDECVDYIEALITAGLAANPKARSLVYWRRRAQLVHNELATIRTQLLRRTPDVIANAYEYGHDIAHVTGDGLDQPAADKNFGSGINKRAIALLAAGMNERFDSALVTVGRRVDDQFRKAALRSVAYHVVAGTDVETAAKHYESQLRRDSIRAFVDRRGHEWSLPAYTKMVIRTTTREAVTQGTFSGLQATGHDIYQVSHHVNSCDICLAYDGKTFSMPDAPESVKAKYPIAPGDKQPPIPAHPNCEHVCAPASQTFDDIEAALLTKYGNAPAVTLHA
jgi:hypothetical protein